MKTLLEVLTYFNFLAIPVMLFSPLLFLIGLRAFLRIARSGWAEPHQRDEVTIFLSWGAIVFFASTLLLFNALASGLRM